MLLVTVIITLPIRTGLHLPGVAATFGKLQAGHQLLKVLTMMIMLLASMMIKMMIVMLVRWGRREFWIVAPST